MSDLAKEAAELDAELAGKTADAPAPGADAAAVTDHTGGDQVPAAPAAPELALEVELAGVAAMIGATLGQFFPSVKPILTEQKCGELGAVLAPVAVKYDLVRYIRGFAWRVELQAAMVVAPVLVAVRQAITADLAAMRAPPAAPSSPALGEGAAVASSAPAAPVEMLKPVAGGGA